MQRERAEFLRSLKNSSVHHYASYVFFNFLGCINAKVYYLDIHKLLMYTFFPIICGLHIFLSLICASLTFVSRETF